MQTSDTHIKKSRNGRRVHMRTLSAYNMQVFAYNMFDQFSKGQTTDYIFQKNAIAKIHKDDFEILMLNRFMHVTTCNDITYSNDLVSMVDPFIKIAKKHAVDLGYIYCLKINNRIKIGRTRSIVKRISTYKSHIGEVPEILKIKLSTTHSLDESLLKALLNQHKSSNEWFELDDYETIMTAIDNITLTS